ncbi:unnamed protein product [Thelazia callipaeda]|uniref:Nucleolar protein 6 n=1 Tax=Thelazia callipaeda TaxID=103827 RepID=A0A158RAM0_THECL|nr:unnamed protein product [Thelazia callipaeda]
MKRKCDGLEQAHHKFEKVSLLCMLVDEYCKEIKLTEVRRLEMEVFAQSVKNAIYAAKESGVVDKMKDPQQIYANNIHFPLSLPFGLDYRTVLSSHKYCWVEPVKIDILGCWHAGYQTKDDSFLDVIVIIPKNYFNSRDYLNFAYFVKRAHYICMVALILVDAGFSVKFGLDHDDKLKPLLFVSSKNGYNDAEVVRIHFAPPRNFAKLSRFRPENNNLRPLFCSPHFTSLGIGIPTPVYNSKIAIEMLRQEIECIIEAFFRENQNFVKAFIMIRSWMFRRNFIQRIDGFTDLLLAAWFIFIHNKGNFFAQTSVFDIIVTFFSSLVATNWKEAHLGLCNNDALHAQFSAHFDFVFLDHTGYINLAASVSIVAWEQIQAAAADVITKINTFSEFDHIFVENSPFFPSFDQYIRISLTQSNLQNIFHKMYSAECVSTCNDLSLILRRKLTPMLKEGLSGRISDFDFDFYVDHESVWDVFEQQKHTSDRLSLLIGFRLSSKWDNLLTRGPPAKSPEAVHFREFWGEVCELRRFPDNSICEAVVWNAPNVIVQERTLDINMMLPHAVESYNIIGRAYDKLSQMLRMVQDLPLCITNIHPISHYLRRTAPFAPLPTNVVIDKQMSTIKNSISFPLPGMSPPYVPTVKVQVTMEQSGKWGDDLGAIGRLKTAFYIELSKILNEKHSVQAVPFDDCLIIHFDAVVFHLVIAYPKEVQIMRRLNGGKTGIPKDSSESKLKELEVILEPQLTAFLHSVSQQFNAFSDTCRLAKYWLSSHALSDYLNGMIVETLVASVFLKPYSLQSPKTAFIAFHHFLMLLYKHNWLMKPLLVDFSNEWTEIDEDEMEKDFIKLRPVLPAMVVCTPVDKSGCRWTSDQPQPLILKRIIALAKSASVFIKQHVMSPVPWDLKGIFTTDVSTLYDVIINIKKQHMVRRRVFRGKGMEGVLPVIDYDPVKKYVEQLRQNFSSVALFFYDKYIGDMIGVVWKPSFMVPSDVRASSYWCRSEGFNGISHINKTAILEDLLILGHDLVKDVIQRPAIKNERMSVGMNCNHKIMDDIENLEYLLAGSSVSFGPNNTAREHPRFSQYKYAGRAEASQAKRREEFLKRQKETRYHYMCWARLLATSQPHEEESTNESAENVEKANDGKRRGRAYHRFAGELMLSEWLVDIPETLCEDWICIPCPLGKRCLVVASNGVTSAYSKSGHLITQFASYLPAGSSSSYGTYAVLDCIFDQKSFTFYCLDLIAWNGQTFVDSEFDCRLFVLNSRITENENFKEVSKQIPYRFLCLPYCRCEYSNMKEMMHRDFGFELDGVLFYHASVYYRKGQNPLVGWLKPWMMPEILSVPVPSRLMNGEETIPGRSQEFIEDFNQKHKHVSMIGKATIDNDSIEEHFVNG